jgi:hypothetical protein
MHKSAGGNCWAMKSSISTQGQNELIANIHLGTDLPKKIALSGEGILEDL